MRNMLFFVNMLALVFAGTVSSADLPSAIKMPAISNDKEALFLLNGIGKQWPLAFAGANDFGVNTVSLLKEQRRLLDELLLWPGYSESFAQRRFVDITITAEKEIETNSLRISPSTVMAWKRSLLEAMRIIKPEPGNSMNTSLRESIERYREFLGKKNHVDKLKQKYRKLNQTIWGPDFPCGLESLFKNSKFRKKKSLQQMALVKKEIAKLKKEAGQEEEVVKRLKYLEGLDNISDIKILVLGLEFDDLTQSYFSVDLKKLNTEIDKIKFIETKLEQLLIEEKLSPIKAAFLEERFAKTKQAKALAQKLEKFGPAYDDEARKKEVELVSLGQLYAALYRNFDGFDKIDGKEFHQAYDAINRLTDDDLSFLADIDALDEPFQWMPEIKTLLNNAFRHYASQQRSYLTKVEAGDRIVLQEIPPLVAIFRGLLGGDCSSKYSFPYPNDANERVFVIRRSFDVDPIGVMSATVVDIEHEGIVKRALYSVTIAGKKLKASDVELIFRGLSKAKAQLGIDEIIIPTKKNLLGLINHMNVFGVYQHHSNAQHMAKIIHRNQDIRSAIENFKSANNSGHYDKMAQNKHGTILRITPDDNDLGVAVELSSAVMEEIKPIDMTTDELVRFALRQHSLKRYEIVQAVFNIPEMASDFQLEKVQKLFQTIDNRDNVSLFKETPYLSGSLDKKYLVSEHRAAVESIIADFGINDLGPEEMAQLTYLGRMNAPDAFSEMNLEESVLLLAHDIKKNFWNPLFGRERLSKDRDVIASAKAFETILQVYWKKANSANDQEALLGSYAFFMLKPKNSHLSVEHRKKIGGLLNIGLPLSEIATIWLRLLSSEEAAQWPEAKNFKKTIFDQLNSPDLKVLIDLSTLFIGNAKNNGPCAKELHQQIIKRLHSIKSGVDANGKKLERENIKGSFHHLAKIFSRIKAVDEDIRTALFDAVTGVLMNDVSLVNEPYMVRLINNIMETNYPVDLSSMWAGASLSQLLSLLTLSIHEPNKDNSPLLAFALEKLQSEPIVLEGISYRDDLGALLRLAHLNRDHEVFGQPLREISARFLREVDNHNLEIEFLGLILAEYSEVGVIDYLAAEIAKRERCLIPTLFDESIFTKLIGFAEKNQNTKSGEVVLDWLFRSIKDLLPSYRHTLQQLLSSDLQKSELLVNQLKMVIEDYLINCGQDIVRLSCWPDLASMMMHANTGVIFAELFDPMDRLGHRILTTHRWPGLLLECANALRTEKALELFPLAAKLALESEHELTSLENFQLYEFGVLYDYFTTQSNAEDLILRLAVKAREKIRQIDDPETGYRLFLHFSESLPHDQELRDDFNAGIRHLLNKPCDWMREDLKNRMCDEKFRDYCEDNIPELKDEL